MVWAGPGDQFNRNPGYDFQEDVHKVAILRWDTVSLDWVKWQGSATAPDAAIANFPALTTVTGTVTAAPPAITTVTYVYSPSFFLATTSIVSGSISIASGSIGVSGAVAATQSGAWVIGLTGTNYIIASPTGSQQISGSVVASLTGTNYVVATDSGSGKTIKVASISLSATGTVIPAVVGKRIKVFACKVVCGAALSINWRDGANLSLEGVQAIALNGGYTEAVNPPAYLFSTTAGNSLDLVITGVGSVGGRVSYFDDDAT